MKKIYTCFCTDNIHEGHINILNEGKKLGYLVVGVLGDEAMIRYNRFPTVSLEERIENVKKLGIADEVVVQNTIFYDEIISSVNPDVIIHGDNWKEGPEKCIRDNVVEILSERGGELVEIPYTYNENVKKADLKVLEKVANPSFRLGRLRKLLKMRSIVKTLEVHSGLTGLIAEKTIVNVEDGPDQFDAMWISSLCDSTAKGKPDIELVDMTSRFRTIDDICEVTTKPIIFDADTGGLTEHFVYTVCSLERMGVSMAVIEDKAGLKKNSLFGTEVEQTQADIEDFCEKISAGKKAQKTDDFMICARIESLILEKGIDDALSRAKAYTNAGADAIMIHSRKSEPTEIFDFVKEYRQWNETLPIVVVPTSFNSVTEEEFKAAGVNIVIYANQLTRAGFPAMKKAAETILSNHRALECDEFCMPFKEIINLIEEK